MSLAINHADMKQWLAAYDGPLFDSCVTDPPYELGFMGKGWDRTGIANDPAAWRAVFDALKPGAHLVAFSGTRTYHRMVCAIEDAGFEIRDQLAWVFGQGFPKSLDVSKAIDKAAGAEREITGKRTDGRYAYDFSAAASRSGGVMGKPVEQASRGLITAPATDAAREWQGWGTALKPAWEPICLARKPLSEPTVAANVLRWGTGGLNIDGCRVGEGVLRTTGNGLRERDDGWGMNGGVVGGSALGRWPANLAHDGSDEVLAGFPDGDKPKAARTAVKGGSAIHGGGCSPNAVGFWPGDNGGSAARFFYCAKAGKQDRIGSKHPTIKPVALMRWLCRMVTPPGGHILEPFAGSGTTGIAAKAEGFVCTMIESEIEHIADIYRKLREAA